MSVEPPIPRVAQPTVEAFLDTIPATEQHSALVTLACEAMWRISEEANGNELDARIAQALAAYWHLRGTRKAASTARAAGDNAIATEAYAAADGLEVLIAKQMFLAGRWLLSAPHHNSATIAEVLKSGAPERISITIAGNDNG